MSEAASSNGTAQASTGQGTTQTQAPDYQKLYESERSHAQHFKSEVESAKSAAKAAQDEANRLKAENDSFKNSAAAGDPKKLEERIKQIEAETEEKAGKRYGGKIGELETKLSESQKIIQRYQVVNPALQIADKIFVPEAKEFVQKAIEENCEIQDGKIVVKGKDGKPLPSTKDPRVLMTVEEFLQEYAAKYPMFAQSQVRNGTMNGSGEKAGSSSNNAALPSGFDTWSYDAQKDFFAKNPEARKAVLSKSSF